MKIEATTLQEAFSNAASKLNCSVTELEYDVIQYPSSGFLGFFKKSAIIEVKTNDKNINLAQQVQSNQPKKVEKNKIKPEEKNKKQEPVKVKQKKQKNKVIIDDKLLTEINQKLVNLFSKSSFLISKIEVKKYDEQTIAVFIDGEDAALMIGKDGRRYKAILYIIHSWINLKYGLNVRLEIAEFLKIQEESISKYLQNVIEKVEANGKASTKPLDGVLIDIALKQLRDKFPEKYVGIKTGNDGKYIIINDYKK